MAQPTNAVRFNAAGYGTADFIVASAATNYQTPEPANVTDGKTYRYYAQSADGTQWEAGSGPYTVATHTLSRTTIQGTSNGDQNPVNFTLAPIVDVFASPSSFLDTPNVLYTPQTLTAAQQLQAAQNISAVSYAVQALTAAQKVQTQVNLGAREILTAARTYYVRTDGSDSNTGLVDSAAGGFLTVAKALAVVAALDCSIYVPTVQVDAATWTVPIVLPRILGSATPVLTGVGSTTIISTTAADCITNDGSGVWQVNNLKLTAITSGNGMTLRNGGVIKFSGIEFGSIPGHQVACFATSSVQATGAFTVSGSASSIFFAQGYVNLIGQTITFSNSPGFSLATFYCFGGYMDVYSMTFTNGATVTGTRYNANMTGAIFTNGGGATYVPGSVAGTTANGGVYA